MTRQQQQALMRLSAMVSFGCDTGSEDGGALFVVAAGEGSQADRSIAVSLLDFADDAGCGCVFYCADKNSRSDDGIALCAMGFQCLGAIPSLFGRHRFVYVCRP